MAEVNKRMAAVTALNKISERLYKDDLSKYDVPQLDQELKSIKEHFNRFVHNHDELVGSAKPDGLSAHDDLWQEVETAYNGICVTLNRAILKKSTDDPNPHISYKDENSASTPSFDGSYSNWLAFKHVFEALVHEADLSEEDKLSELLRAIHCSGVRLTGGNYQEKWGALKDKFDNRRILWEIHISPLINMVPAAHETMEALLTIVGIVQESLLALRSLNLPVEQWNALVVPLVVSKLPSKTRLEWTMSCFVSQIPTTKDLLDFLERRSKNLFTNPICSSFCAVAAYDQHLKRQNRNQPRVKCNVSSVDDGKCYYCQGSHSVKQCLYLRGLLPEERLEAFKDLRVCFNCLQNDHSIWQCTSSGCEKCGRKHHYIFCNYPVFELKRNLKPKPRK